MNSLTPLSPPAASLPTPAASPAADEKSLVQILWHRRRIVAGCVTLALVAAVAYLLIAKPTYTSVARLFIEASGGKKAGQDAADRAAFLFTQSEVITSTPVLATALGQPGILDFATFAKKPDAITAIRNDLNVEVGKKAELVTLSLESPYPDESTQIISAIVNAYTRFQTTQRGELTSETFKILQGEKAQVDKEIADRTAMLQAFSLEHRIDNADALAGSADSDALRSINASLTQANLDAMNSGARVPASAPADWLAEPDGNYTAEDEAAVRQQLQAAEARFDALSAKYAPTYRLVMEAKLKVEQLRAKRYAVLKAVHAAAVKRAADLQKYYEAEQRRHIEQRAFAAEYVRMNGERLRLQERADAIDTRLRDLRVNDEKKMADVSMLEPAHASPLATGPKKGKTLGLALVAGLMLGVAAALAWDQFDSRLESSSQIDRWLGLATLGALPGLPAGGPSAGRQLYSYSEPNSPFAFACRGVWAALNAYNRGAIIKTLAVTSASRGDGRTTAACGLAIAMAQHGRRALLIDADARSPGLAALLGVNAGTGLANVLNAANVDAGLVHQHARETPVANLYVLAGGRPDTADHPNLAALLDAAGRAFDVVVIDTPAAHKNAAARVIAANCQATLMVVRLGHTDAFAAGRVRRDLYTVGANVLGVVLNTASGGNRVPTVTVAPMMPPELAGPRDALGLPTDAAPKSGHRPNGGLSVAS